MPSRGDLLLMSLLSMCLAAMATLGGCASGPRQGPPAPVVQVTPKPEAAPVLTQMPQPDPDAAASEPKAKPKPKPPAQKVTRTYAYKEPGSEPEPPPAPSVEPVEEPADETVASPAPVQRPKPAPTQAPAPPTAPQVAKAPPQRPDRPVAVAPPRSAAPEVPAPVAVAPPPLAAPAEPLAARVAPPAAADKPLAPGLPVAADSLARQAEQQRQSGDYAGAAASLERSLRISPREPYLWNRLARVRMEQGLSAQAGQLAARSNDLAGGQASLKKDNWRIIAEARRRAGDAVGAGQADQKAGGG